MTDVLTVGAGSQIRINIKELDAYIQRIVRLAIIETFVQIRPEVLRFWQSIVTVRSGRMARGLRVNLAVPKRRNGAFVISFDFAKRAAFYYAFQRRRGAWNQAVAQRTVELFTRRFDAVLQRRLR